MKLILIARVSDKNQRQALPAQKLKLKNYAATRDPKAEYYEFDESAHGDVRKKFAKLIEHIEERSQKELIAVVFCKIDRYTRDSSQDEVKALNQLVKQGQIELHFPDDNLFINKDSPATDLFRLGIGTALAKYYSDSIKDNIARRFSQMLNDGLWIGQAPLAYKNVHKGSITKPIKDIEIDPDKAPHVIKMFERRSTGMSYAMIAKLANKEGMTSKKGKKMSKSTIEKITRNTWYYGKMSYMGKLYSHNYPPLIDKTLFDKCMSIRSERHDQHTKYKSIPFVFNNFVKCQECGCMISSFIARNNTYLKCSKAAKYKECNNLNTAEKLVMPQMLELLDLIPLSDSVFELLVNEVRQRFGNQQQYLKKSVDETRKKYDDVTAQLKALTYERLESVKTGKGISTELFDEIVEELTNKQQILNQRLIKLTDYNNSFLITASHLLDLGMRCNQLFKTSDNLLKQKILRVLLYNVEMYGKSLSYTVNDPYKAFIELNKKEPNGSNSQLWCG